MDGNWYSGSVESSFRALGSSPSGLSEAQAQSALQKGGYNELVAEKKDPWYKLYFSQFNSLPIAMLLAAAAISAALGFLVNPEKLIDAGAISVAMLIATTFGFWQEFKAEQIDSAKAAISKADQTIRAHPYEAIGIAFGIGILLGAFLRRK